MSRVVPGQLTGVIVPDPDFCPAAREASSTTATEGSPEPGRTTNTNNSAMDLEQAGQSWSGETLTLESVKAGSVGVPGASAARVKWSGQAGKSGTTARGWLPFNVATGWGHVSSAATLDGGTYPGVGTLTQPHGIRLLSGRVLIAAVSTYLGAVSIACVSYDPEIGDWDPSVGRYDSGSSSYVWSARDAYTWVPVAVDSADLNNVDPSCPCLLQLPSGRILLFL